MTVDEQVKAYCNAVGEKIIDFIGATHLKAAPELAVSVIIGSAVAFAIASGVSRELVQAALDEAYNDILGARQ